MKVHTFQRFGALKKRLVCTMAVCCLFVLGLGGCGDRLGASTPISLTPESQQVTTNQLLEVATPPLIEELRKELDQYQPQLKILSPQPDEVVNSTSVSVQLQVDDLPLFKDPDLAMGPHVHLFMDDEPYRAVYDETQPVVFEKLSPGSHTIRAFASRPWHESFKNEGAYATTTFHVYTKTNANTPDPAQPLLTYSRPQGTYGAEPIMLDFYLTNAPLHFVAQEDQTDSVADWRIRATVNGETFILDNWQPIYLKGFHKGENWLKLEFINDQGELVENVFNNPVRVIDYDPKLKDTLAKLVQNKLSLRTAKKLVTTKMLPPEPEVTEIIEPEEEILDVEPITPETEAVEKLSPIEETTEPEEKIEDSQPEILSPDEKTEIQTPEPSTAPETVEEKIEESIDAVVEESTEDVSGKDDEPANPESVLETTPEATELDTVDSVTPSEASESTEAELISPDFIEELDLLDSRDDFEEIKLAPAFE